MDVMIGVTILTTAVLDVISVRTETNTAINNVMTHTGNGANTVSTSPRNSDRPDSCNATNTSNFIDRLPG